MSKPSDFDGPTAVIGSLPAAPVHPTPLLDELARAARSGQQGLIPGSSDKVGYWLTPPKVMAALHAEFDFNFDACPYPRPPGYDGLKEPWGSRAWVNPPFVGPGSSRTAWARKAISEYQQGKTVVMINSMDRWLIDLIRAGVELRVPPDFKWLDTKGRPQESSRPNLLFILDASKKLCLCCRGSGKVPK